MFDDLEVGDRVKLHDYIHNGSYVDIIKVKKNYKGHIIYVGESFIYYKTEEVEFDPMDIDYIVKKIPQCECGAKSVNGNEFQHSYYCPRFKGNPYY